MSGSAESEFRYPVALTLRHDADDNPVAVQGRSVDFLGRGIDGRFLFGVPAQPGSGGGGVTFTSNFAQVRRYLANGAVPSPSMIRAALWRTPALGYAVPWTTLIRHGRIEPLGVVMSESVLRAQWRLDAPAPSAAPPPAQGQRRRRGVVIVDEDDDDDEARPPKRTRPQEDIMLLEPSGRIAARECGICMRDEGLLRLWSNRRATMASLQDLAALPEGVSARLPDDVLLWNPCRRHCVCVRCLRHILLNPDHAPVNHERAAVACVSLSEPSGDRCPTLYETRWLRWVLGDEERRAFEARAHRHRFPGYVAVTCPCTIFSSVQYGQGSPAVMRTRTCGAECLVSHEHITRQVPGTLVVRCSQNRSCFGSFCFHCRTRLTRFDTQCTRCTQQLESQAHPQAHNRYFHRPASKTRDDATAHLYRNSELTLEIVEAQLVEMIEMEPYVVPQCFCCGVPLYKTSMCNGLTHCGVQKCYVCGRNTPRGGSLETGHWDATGRRGCPRFDNNAYWADSMRPTFHCLEMVCYGDTRECTKPQHRAGIVAMHRERKYAHVHSMLASLAPPLRRSAMEALRRRYAASADASTLLARVRTALLASPQLGTALSVPYRLPPASAKPGLARRAAPSGNEAPS